MKKQVWKISGIMLIAGQLYFGAMAQNNVGIGTNAPTARLEVVGTTNTSAESVLHLKSLNGTTLFHMRNDGNTGIGIAPGTSKVRINSTTTSNNVDFLFNGAYQGGIRANDSAMVISSASNGICIIGQCPTPNRLIIQPPTSSGGFIASEFPGWVGMFTNTPRTSFHVNGNMILGTSDRTPVSGYRLNVEGKIICEEVRVQLSSAWPDYVFAQDYPLMPIDQLEKKVKSQKHLPGVPSAEEINALKGVDMGETQRILLEKIEELYLYMFEMNNRMEMLEKENKALKAKD
jgi:hypothetical protein